MEDPLCLAYGSRILLNKYGKDLIFYLYPVYIPIIMRTEKRTRPNTKKSKFPFPLVFSLGVGAGIGALTLFLFAPGNVLLTLVAFLGGSLIGRIVAPRPGERKAEIEQEMPAFGVSRESLETALQEGLSKMNTIKSEAAKIPDSGVRKEVEAICEVIGRILITIKNDPKDLRPARQFLDYYLEATRKIVAQYVDLTEKRVQSEEISQTLKKVEESLGTIHRAFERQLELLLQYDVMNLDSELTLLRRTIEMEGLGGLPKPAAKSAETPAGQE